MALWLNIFCMVRIMFSDQIMASKYVSNSVSYVGVLVFWLKNRWKLNTNFHLHLPFVYLRIGCDWFPISNLFNDLVFLSWQHVCRSMLKIGSREENIHQSLFLNYFGRLRRIYVYFFFLIMYSFDLKDNNFQDETLQYNNFQVETWKF